MRSRVWQDTLVIPPANLGFIVLAKKGKEEKLVKVRKRTLLKKHKRFKNEKYHQSESAG